MVSPCYTIMISQQLPFFNLVKDLKIGYPRSRVVTARCSMSRGLVLNIDNGHNT